jgi:hypothetical protein
MPARTWLSTPAPATASASSTFFIDGYPSRCCSSTSTPPAPTSAYCDVFFGGRDRPRHNALAEFGRQVGNGALCAHDACGERGVRGVARRARCSGGSTRPFHTFSAQLGRREVDDVHRCTVGAPRDCSARDCASHRDCASPAAAGRRHHTKRLLAIAVPPRRARRTRELRPAPRCVSPQ